GCAAHLATGPGCRQRLDDLRAIRRALAARPVVDAPPAGDWSGFMRRLDEAVGAARAPVRPAAVLEASGRTWRVRQLVLIAATLVLVTTGVFMAARGPPPQGPAGRGGHPEAAAPRRDGCPGIRQTEPDAGGSPPPGQRRASRALQARRARPGGARSEAHAAVRLAVRTDARRYAAARDALVSARRP